MLHCVMQSQSFEYTEEWYCIARHPLLSRYYTSAVLSFVNCTVLRLYNFAFTARLPSLLHNICCVRFPVPTEEYWNFIESSKVCLFAFTGHTVSHWLIPFRNYNRFSKEYVLKKFLLNRPRKERVIHCNGKSGRPHRHNYLNVLVI